MIWSIRELTSSMCWSVWPDTVLRRCLILSHPSITPVDMKRWVYALDFPPFLSFSLLWLSHSVPVACVLRW